MDESRDIDHKAIIASLSAAERAELTGRRDAPGLFRFAAHFGCILVGAALILAGIPFWWLVLVPQGILIVFLFTTLHEAIHETAFRSGRLNQAVAAIAGFLVLIPPSWFRYFHFAHHRHTHDPDNDPELMSPKPETAAQYLTYLSGIPLWIGMARTMLRNAFFGSAEPYVSEKGRAKVKREARLFLLLYAVLAMGSVAAGSVALLWVWVVPALLGQPFLRAYLLAEHARCPHVANMLENTRTTFTTALVRFVAWNMPYHAEHHAYPAVPFHKLPRFHEVVRAHLRVTERGYISFNRKFWAELD
ncbi:fatty acid desaturase [Mesorhizobium sp. L-8-10]|uniref:fatty acid desaturase family protein n=1 Tax=Mesorhizobium sp. L-8-10 TaxID=2744523 RepID=UPI0019382A79|nr:fatty acid desaturase family protein [Mesorhizobium sp. L-8-10]BCH29129.1 fatty acid desaturase [Mesorhizobium sp. L-8-10]